MTNAIQKIVDLLDQHEGRQPYLESLFGDALERIRRGVPIIVFGAGSLGQELADMLHHEGFRLACFADNNPKVQGRMLARGRVVSIIQAIEEYPDAVCLVGALRSREQLREDEAPVANGRANGEF